MNLLAQKRKNILIKDTPAPSTKSQSFDDYYYEQVAKISGVGGWWVNFEEKKSYIDPQGRRILKLPKDYNFSLRTSLELYEDEYRDLAQEKFAQCAEGIPFDMEIKMQPLEGGPIWVHASASPIYNEQGSVIGVRGIFRNIDQEKNENLQLKNSLAIIESQNSKLFHFAHIVSHHLESHASNLELTLQLIKDANSPEEQLELIQNIEAISKELKGSIHHLSEISSSQKKCRDEYTLVSFSEVMKKVLATQQNTISEYDIEIFSDFSEIPEIEYIPHYIENYLVTLINNALKFRHHNRQPNIQIFSYYEEDKPCLMFKDNGIGMEIDNESGKVFQVNDALQDQLDDMGVGLFILKSQVESLGGSIEVESEPNRGTIFRIFF